MTSNSGVVRYIRPVEAGAYAIECRRLVKRYGRRVAVAGVDLAVREAEIFGLVGPNGAGKTTILKMLLGLVRPTAGEIFVFGTPAPCPAALHAAGSMVDKPAFYPWLTARGNLRVFLDGGPPGPPHAVERALESVGLTADGDRLVKTFSQGMRQRLGMAAALMRRPKLLILDEPANGLDPSGIRDLRRLLLDVSAGGTTVLLSSHLLAEVEKICHRVAFIANGSIGEVRTVADLQASTRMRVTVPANQEAEALAALAGFDPARVGKGVLVVRGVPGEEIARTLGSVGIFASAVEPERDSLEDVYLRVVDSSAGVGD